MIIPLEIFRTPVSPLVVTLAFSDGVFLVFLEENGKVLKKEKFDFYFEAKKRFKELLFEVRKKTSEIQ